MEKLYNVGAYVRLSMEAASYESDSVENQVSMLSKFIALMPGWVEQKFYIDDGFSGVSFQRPAFQEMIEDVKQGKINLVLVKDLSRFGRNYLEAGHYLEELLPSLGCRFVAFQDGIDTEDGENDVMAFLNAMNDYYVKNHSDRIRSVMRAKALDGQKVSGHAPYGYRRREDDNTRLEIDEYSAGVVRRIFEMRKSGMGRHSIAQVLNGEGILPPMLYYYSTTEHDESKAKAKTWRPSYLGKMLKNELYIGNAVQFEKMVVSYRDKREITRPEDEWIRVDGAFPAIIDKALWEDVQAVNEAQAKHYGKKRPPQKKLFSDVLVCADCGGKMAAIQKAETSKTGTVYVHYICSRFISSAGENCTRHSVGQLSLAKLILGKINEAVKGVVLNEKAIIKALTKRLVGEKRMTAAKKAKEIAALKQRIHKCEVAISKLYEKRVMGQIAEDAFLKQVQQSETERLNAEKRLADLEVSEATTEAKLSDIQNWISLIKENATVKELNRDLLLTLIDKIEVGEGKMVDGIKEQAITIHYKFIGAVAEGSESA